MNSIPNNDSEQCIESKLSQEHSAPTLGPACAHTAPCRKPGLAVSKPGLVVSKAWPGRVAGLAWSCRSARLAVSQRTPGRVAVHASAPCRTPASVAAHRVLASPAVSCSQLAVSWPCPRPCRSLSCDTTQRPSRPPVTIHPFVSQHNPPAVRPSSERRSPLREHRQCRRASRPCRRPSHRQYRGPIRSCPGRMVGVDATPCLMCHDTMHCIVTKAGKWAKAHLTTRKIFFFFTSFFFSFVHLLEDHKKTYYFFFHFSVEPNKFIKIYFIFFPVLHTIKPKKKKKIINTFFFPMCYSPSTQFTQPHIIHNIHQNPHHSSKCTVYA